MAMDSSAPCSDRLLQEVGPAVAARLASGQQTVDDVARDLHASLTLRNESTKHLVVENIYVSHQDPTASLKLPVLTMPLFAARHS